MNTVNQTFNWSRFTAAVRKEIVENSRPILFGVLGIYVFLSIIMIVGNVVGVASGDIIGFMENAVPQRVALFVLMFLCVIIPSLAFRNLKSKTGRIELFMSPSSTLEKFLVNALIYVLGAIVAFFICAQLADLTRIVALLYFKDENFLVPGPINFLNMTSAAVQNFSFSLPGIFPDNVNNTMAIAAPLSLLVSAGLYLLGSIVWPRLSLLKTLAAVYAIETVLGIIGILCAFIFLNENNIEAFGNWMMGFIGEGKFFYWMLGWNIILLALNWGLAWYLFKRKDIISLKWWK